jgi:hypothetical protein
VEIKINLRFSDLGLFLISIQHFLNQSDPFIGTDHLLSF